MAPYRSSVTAYKLAVWLQHQLTQWKSFHSTQSPALFSPQPAIHRLISINTISCKTKLEIFSSSAKSSAAMLPSRARKLWNCWFINQSSWSYQRQHLRRPNQSATNHDGIASVVIMAIKPQIFRVFSCRCLMYNFITVWLNDIFPYTLIIKQKHNLLV